MNLIKMECERIWRDEPLAFPNNIAGWLTKALCFKLGKGHYETLLLSRTRGKRLLYRKAIKKVKWPWTS